MPELPPVIDALMCEGGELIICHDFMASLLVYINSPGDLIALLRELMLHGSEAVFL